MDGIYFAATNSLEFFMLNHALDITYNVIIFPVMSSFPNANCVEYYCYDLYSNTTPSWQKTAIDTIDYTNPFFLHVHYRPFVSPTTITLFEYKRFVYDVCFNNSSEQHLENIQTYVDALNTKISVYVQPNTIAIKDTGRTKHPLLKATRISDEAKAKYDRDGVLTSKEVVLPLKDDEYIILNKKQIQTAYNEISSVHKKITDGKTPTLSIHRYMKWLSTIGCIQDNTAPIVGCHIALISDDATLLPIFFNGSILHISVKNPNVQHLSHEQLKTLMGIVHGSEYIQDSNYDHLRLSLKQEFITRSYDVID